LGDIIASDRDPPGHPLPRARISAWHLWTASQDEGQESAELITSVCTGACSRRCDYCAISPTTHWNTNRRCVISGSPSPTDSPATNRFESRHRRVSLLASTSVCHHRPTADHSRQERATVIQYAPIPPYQRRDPSVAEPTCCMKSAPTCARRYNPSVHEILNNWAVVLISHCYHPT